jgi:preprotein translocase subunit SecE
MQKITLYIKECYNELMHKVSWPTWNELQSSAIVVLTASLIIGIVVFLMDSLFQGTMNLIYSLFD